jgi:Ca2+ transporting ATPase
MLPRDANITSPRYGARITDLCNTGESCSVMKSVEATTAEKAVYQDKTNILFSVSKTFCFCVNALIVVC